MSSSKLVRRILAPDSAGPAGGPYSKGVVIGQMLYLSGAIGLDPKTGQFAGEGVEEQARQALKNLGEVLKAADVSYKNVVKANVFLKDINDFAAMNEVYSEFFNDRHPARTTVQVAGLPRNAKIEIEAVAFLGDIQDETTFTNHQIDELEKAFKGTHYPDVFAQELLSVEINLPKDRKSNSF